ncbi:hypothetical protein MKEN_01193800 [Mycena kentingensis (nom. inval.)]|nr:hypothetical protein MKEN_01193800 [Mycena kentingensis (nom. inval.)]
MSSESQPLLGHRPRTLRERVAAFLESPLLHKLVLLLIALDAIFIGTDIGYAFLHESCTPAEGPGVPPWLTVLAQLSLTINTLFLIEIPLSCWAIGFDFYNPFGDVPHAALHCFDAFIICTTFILEVVLRGKEQELAGLLIVLRLWRLIKLVGGVSVGVGHFGEEDAIRAKTAEEQVAQLEKENAELRARLAEAGVSVN